MQFTVFITRSYRVLTQEEREEIMIGHRQRESIRSIAGRLKRNPSVISREIRNNSTEEGRYQAYWAQMRSERRRRQSRWRERIADRLVRQYVHEKLSLGWSPEQISGRIRLDMPDKRVSHETIYQYVFKKERSLIRFLVCGRKNRRKQRVNRRTKRVVILHRTGIEERPDYINNREETGHWEADTAVSRQSKQALMVLQERMSGLTFLKKLPRCTAEEMNDSLTSRLAPLPEAMRRSITFDNGPENRHHYILRDQLNCRTYFCTPYSSWQRGSVEHAVGLTRREWPKKTDYALISDEEIATLEYRFNTRPRKRFGYLTPFEYTESVASSH